MSNSVWKPGVGALSGVLLAIALAACSQAPQKGASGDAATGGEAVAAEGYNARPDDYAAAEPGSTTSTGAHAYAERDGNKFYYQTGDGQMLPVVDKGWSYDEATKKFARVLFQDGVQLVNYVGSNVVHTRVFSANYGGVLSVTPGEKVALDGDSVAAVAMRDALNGHLSAPGTPPTKAEWEAAVAERTANNEAAYQAALAQRREEADIQREKSLAESEAWEARRAQRREEEAAALVAKCRARAENSPRRGQTTDKFELAGTECSNVDW